MGYKQTDMGGIVSVPQNETIEFLDSPHMKLLEKIIESNNTVLEMNKQIFELVQKMGQPPMFIRKES